MESETTRTTKTDMENWSDSNLYQYCKKWGAQILLGKRKFIGALPEVYRRRLYKRRGYASIHEFAAKLAGLSHESVDKVLNLSKKLEDKPVLKSLFESGEQGWSKIEKVAYIATPETEKDWAKRVETMPQLALEALVREQNNREEFTLKSETEPEKFTSLTFKVKPTVELKLRQLKQKLEKERGEAMSFGEVLEELLNKRESSAPEEKKVTIQICPNCVERKAKTAEEAESVTRPIPTNVERVVLARQENRCAFNGCNKPPEIFHHTRRFSLIPGHDPNFIVALCKAHERLAHCGLIGNEEKSPTEWFVREWPNETSNKFAIDQKVAAYRGG